MNRPLTLLSLGCLLATAASATAQSLGQISITVHTSGGDQKHTAPAVGQAPVTLEQAMQTAGVTYTATWFSSVPGYAAMIIDGQPSTTNGNFATPFWWVCINGYSSAAGLQTLVKAGDQIEWSWVTTGKCAKDSGH